MKQETSKFPRRCRPEQNALIKNTKTIESIKISNWLKNCTITVCIHLSKCLARIVYGVNSTPCF